MGSTWGTFRLYIKNYFCRLKMEDGTPEAIKAAIIAKFPNAVKIDSEVTWDGCCQDLAVVTTIIDNSFEGVKLLQRHKMVKEAIAPYNDKIHKVTIKTHTVEEAKKKGL